MQLADEAVLGGFPRSVAHLLTCALAISDSGKPA